MSDAMIVAAIVLVVLAVFWLATLAGRRRVARGGRVASGQGDDGNCGFVYDGGGGDAGCGGDGGGCGGD